MMQLPKIELDPKLTEHLCKCRPVCKNRRREWKGQLQKTSKELLVERKPIPACRRRWPREVYPNGPCPLLRRVKGNTIKEMNYIAPRPVVRVCLAPLDNTVDTTYLNYAAIARKIGAWGLVHSCCNQPFCACGTCCPCTLQLYKLNDTEHESRRRNDMRKFDARVKTDYQKMRIMYQ